MKECEVIYVAEDLYNRTINAKQNGEWTENDLKLETELYKELNALDPKFHFYWHMQLRPSCFTAKDKGIVPIFKKYIGRFDNIGLTSICLKCLGVPKLYDATEICIQWYYKCKNDVNSDLLASVVNSIYAIKDPRYVKEYLEIIKDDKYLNLYVSFIIELLGKFKVKEALPRIIELLDCDKLLIVVSAIKALGYYGEPNNICYLLGFLDHEESNIMNQAARSIKRMGGLVEKKQISKRKYHFIYQGLK